MDKPTNYQVMYCADCVSGNRNAAAPYRMRIKVGEKADGSPKYTIYDIPPGDPDLITHLERAVFDANAELMLGGHYAVNPLGITEIRGRILCSIHSMDYR